MLKKVRRIFDWHRCRNAKGMQRKRTTYVVLTTPTITKFHFSPLATRRHSDLVKKPACYISVTWIREVKTLAGNKSTFVYFQIGER